MSVIVSNLTKIFGKQRAVDKLSFEVRTGEIVGFLGPNGAGKSTTMKIATGYLPPSEGTVKVCGFDVSTQSMDVRRNIGYLPEHNPLYLDMYVKEYLRFIGELHQIKGTKLRNRVTEMIELTGLNREQGKKIGALSKGYRQRVGLAQALLHNPPVLILDEPTTGLDPNQIVEIRNLIKTISKEKTIIFSTHIMQEVQAICDRAIIIHLGQIRADSEVSALKSMMQTENIIFVEFAQAVDEGILKSLSGVNSLKKIATASYEIRTDAQIDVRASLSQTAGKQGWTLLGLRQEESSLENVFRELTQ